MMQGTGLIIKNTNYSEANKILTILTPRGKLQAVANGARSHKSPVFASMQLFCYSEFVLRKGKGSLPYIQSGEIIENFYDLRFDVEKVALSAYFCDILNIIPLGEETGDVLRLALNTLYILKTRDSVKLIKPAFELRLLCMLGYEPLLNGCVRCGNAVNEGRFSMSDGGMLCAHCAGGVSISNDVLCAMKHIVESQDKSLFAFDASKQVEGVLSSVCESYMIHQLEYIPKTLEYYKSVF